jgi:hypothetical protein
MRKLFFPIILCALSVSAWAADGKFALQRGQSVTLALPDKPSATELFAAEELSRYLGLLLDVKTTTVPWGSSEAILRVGTVRKEEEGQNSWIKETGESRQESYLLSTTESAMSLRGGGDRGTLYAVYDFLEQAGCRWYVPGPLGEVVPRLGEFEMPSGERVEKPAFLQREISSPGSPSNTPEEVVDWQVKNRLNRDFNLRNNPAWSKRGGAIQWHWIAHNYDFILPVDEYFTKKPEWFALYKGRRVKLGKESANICTTNPEVLDFFSNFVAKWFRDNPNGSVFPLSPPDGMIRWCECPDCLALGGKNFTAGPEGSMSRRQLAFVNAIAERVYGEFPDRRILLLAYQNFVDPPEGMKAAPNVIIQPVNYGAFGKSMIHPANKRQRERFEGWAKLADSSSGTPGIWDYIVLQVDGRSGPRLAPLPLTRVMAENIRFMHGLGGRFYFTQAGRVSDVNPFLLYATTKLLWNPETDLDALLRDFCKNFYGAGADAMRSYWTLLEDAVEKSDWNPSTWPEVTIPSGKVFTPEVLASAKGFLKEAEALAGSSAEKQRVQWAKASIETVEQSVALSVPWRLQRGKEAYLTNADAKEDVEARVRGLAAERKNSGDPEGSLTRLINRLPKQARPIEVLRNSAAEAAFLPALGGRLLRFRATSGGPNVFFEPSQDLLVENVSQSYLRYGGYEEYLGKNFADPGWELPFEGVAKGASITMHSAMGSLLWTRRAELAPDQPLLKLTTTLKNEGSVPTELVLRGHPELTLDAPLARLILCWKGAASVSRVPLSAGLPEQPLGAWAVYDPVTRTGIIHRFDTAAATASLHLDMETQSFNLETMAFPVSLPKGGQFSFTQEWEIFPAGTIEEIEAKL